MKKFYFLLLALFSFMGITTAMAQDDEIVVEISKNTGGWTASGSPAYANEYETKDKEHGIRIKCANNNMTFWDGTWLSIYSALSSSQTYDYTVTSLSKTHYISKVEFDFTPGKHPSFQIGPISVTIEETTARAEVGNTEHFEFVNEDNNGLTQLILTVGSDETSYHAFANTSNFYITLMPRPAIDVAWDKLIEIMDAHEFEEEQFPTDGTPGSYDEAARDAFFSALVAAHALEDEDPETITEEMLAQHGQAVIDTYDALLASKVGYSVADGYYRIRTGLTYSTGDKYMYAYEQVNTSSTNYYYSLWATPEDGDVTDAVAILWKVSKKGEGYDVVPAIYPTMHFNPVSVSALSSSGSIVPRMTEDGAGELVFDPQATIDGITYFNIYASADNPSGQTIFHQGGHSSGAGNSGMVITWYPTYTAASGAGPSEWYLEPVSDAEVEEILAAYEPIRQQKELTTAYNELKATAEKELTDSKELQYTALITEVAQLSSPYTSSAEGSLAALIDNSSTTYWHSDYSSSPGYHVHYLQVALHEGGYDKLQLSMTRRNGAGNDHITQWGVFGSNDPEAADEDWVELASLDMPFANNTETKTATFDSQGYQYLRFYIDRTTGGETRGFGHCSEFQLYQIEVPETSQYAIIGEPAKALDNILEEQASVNPEEVTQEEFDALQAAYDAFKAQFVDPAELREVIAKAESFANGIVVGSNPGQWTSSSVADQLQQILADAKAYDDAKVYKQATSQDFTDKINAQLDAIIEAANAIKTDTWYRFRFGSEATFEANGWDTAAGAAVISSEDESVQDEALWDKYVVAANAEDNEDVRSVVPIYTDEARLGQGLYVDADEEIQDAELAHFRFIAVGDTAYMIQNRATGLFVKAAGTTGGVTLDLHPTLFNVSPLGFGFNLVAAKDLEGTKQNYLHVARNYNQLVTWDASNIGSRSSLLIEEVGSAASYTEPGFYMEVKPGALYAMCYPVDITIEEGNGALYSVSKVEGTHVSFAAIDKVEAGRPFVYKMGEVDEYNEENIPDIVKLHHGYDLQPEAQQSGNFAGTYTQKTLGEGYIITGGAIRAILGIYHNNEPLNQLFMTETFITNSVNAHGAYIIPEEGATGAVTFDFDGTEDGIVIATDDVRGDGKVYSIDGRVIGTADNLRGVAKGLYIINGTKVLVK